MHNSLDKILKTQKNLLAFSAGVDSSALFFLLQEANIPFDIALVNYGLRDNSDKEEAHAKTLAKKYHLHCYTKKAPRFTNNFEKNARDFRYDFFEELITIHQYDTLLTAHQLDDQLEWLLMRLSKGAGLSELLGLQSMSQRENYRLIRPLLSFSKAQLQSYLDTNDFPYFIDKSNFEEKYERNYFRKKYSTAFLAEFTEGIKRSFDYLHEDKKALESRFEVLFEEKKLSILKLHQASSKAKACDLCLKQKGYLLSASQRKELTKQNTIVIGGVWAIEIYKDLLYICPYSQKPMPKIFKEQCRVLKIPQKIRSYCFEEEIDLTLLHPC